MTIAKVGKTSVTVINSLTQDCPDDHIQPTYEMTPKLKPITVRTVNREEKCDITFSWWQNFCMSTILFDRDGHWHCRTVKERTCMGYRFVPKYNYTTGKSYTSILQETVC